MTPGWRREGWKWAYRDQAGTLVAFWHLYRLAELDWPDVQASAVARTGQPLPPEAEPTEQDRYDQALREGTRPAAPQSAEPGG